MGCEAPRQSEGEEEACDSTVKPEVGVLAKPASNQPCNRALKCCVVLDGRRLSSHQ